MQFQFRLDNGYDFHQLLLLNKVVVRRKRSSRIFVPILRTCLIVVGLFFLITGSMLLFGGYGEIFTGIACITAGLLWSMLGVLYYRYGAWKSRSLLIKNLGTVCIDLNTIDIHEKTLKSDAHYAYSAIQELCFYKDSYFLFLDKRHALILSLKNLTCGAPELLLKTLEERCGKIVTQL